MTSKTALEDYFATFRTHIIGQRQTFTSPFGKKEIIYADWTASGRAYRPIEEYIQEHIFPFIGNTHTATTITGSLMSKAYETAKAIVKKHVHAISDDVLIFCGSGMTGAVNKLQRILGLRMPEQIFNYVKENALENGDAVREHVATVHRTFSRYLPLDEELLPVVFITHMEHNSNHITWLETIATVEIIGSNEKGNVDIESFKTLLELYKHRKNKIVAITACSNVTGIETPYHEIAKLMHQHGGLCFVDFACSAPYIDINMHPEECGAHLDAIYFSPHKFLGGPGTPGVLIFNKKIYRSIIPDQPGGGTVLYTNPWGFHEYIPTIEQREDGGTPPFLGGIKAAMCIQLKEVMGTENILQRELEILQIVFDRFSRIKNIEVLEGYTRKRLGVISFIVKGAHYDLIVKLLNDRFGVQTRGGCSCAGTYGHKLLRVDKKRSYEILSKIRLGDMLCKPGWIRLSTHPTMTNRDIHFIMDAIEATASHFKEWAEDYTYNLETNEYAFKSGKDNEQLKVKEWFKVSEWVQRPNPLSNALPF